LLALAGWHVCDYKLANIHAARGVAVREFELASGVLEAKKKGATLSGVERQSDRYVKGLPATLPGSLCS
jgi:type I restriction enzyme R subunit